LRRFIVSSKTLFGLIGALILLVAIFGAVNPLFVTARNLLDILRQMSNIAIIAIGMTWVIISGEIDLSVGSLVAASSAVFGYLTINVGVPIFLSFLSALGLGLINGLFVGVLRNHFRVPSFITTLGLLSIWRGVAYLITDGYPISPFPQHFSFWGSGRVLGVPVAVYVMVFLFAAGIYLLNETRLGRFVFATGSNSDAAMLSGVPVERIRTFSFMFTGVMAAIVAILVSSRLMASTPVIGQTWELDVIAAVIIGGCSLAGGKGSLYNTFVGAALIAALRNGMVMLGVPPYVQFVVQGSIIIVAVLLSNLELGRTRKVSETAPTTVPDEG
jgi:ribose/xylose/arabinose/galactoside ABC-type transport system permease subunit